MTKSFGKLIITSSQRNFGPQLSGAATIDLAAAEFQLQEVALKLLLAEADLI